MSARARRIVCYAVNGGGLGHVTRLLAVARWMRRYGTFLEGRPPEILFLTSTEATSVLMRAGFPAFKVPSKTAAKAGGLDPQAWRRLARHFVWQALGTMDPDLLLVDTFPAGSFDELFQVLDGPVRTVFLQRRVRPEYGARPIYRAAMGLYDRVVVPHREEAAAREGVTAAPGARFVGEVLQVDRADLLPRARARASLGVPAEARLIYVSAGGGGDPGSEAALKAVVDALSGDPRLHVLVGAGPLYHGARLGGPRLTWYTEPGVAAYFGACDAAVAAAGYNTFHELLHVGVPSVFFAQDKVADDQQRRVDDAAARGACVGLADAADAAAVERAVAEVLEPARGAALREAARAWMPDNGAARCAREVLGACYEDARVSRAAALVDGALAREAEALADGGAVALGRWLPALLPDVALAGRVPNAALESLLARLSEGAADEVRAALAADDAEAGMSALRDALGDLFRAAAAAELSPDRHASLVELALRKHPPSQEADDRWLPWAARVVSGLARVVARPGDPRDVEARLRLYRLFPRLVDADAAAAFARFEELLAATTSEDAEATASRLQALKLGRSRLGIDDVAPLLAGRQP